MALVSRPSRLTGSSERDEDRSTSANTAFWVNTVALTALLIWVGPRAPRLFGLCFLAWLVNVLVWRPARRASGYALIAISLTCLVTLDFSQLPTTTRFIAAGGITVCLLPWLTAPLRRNRHLPAIHAYCVVAGVYLTVGSMLSHDHRILTQTVSNADRRVGLLLYALFLAMAVVGATLVVGRLSRRPTDTSPDVSGAGDDQGQPLPSFDAFRPVALIVGSIVLSTGVRALGLSSQLGTIVDVIYTMRLVGYIILTRELLKGRRLSPAALLVLGVGVIYDVLLGLGTTALFGAARTPFVIMVLFIHLRRRVPWVPIVLAAAAVISLNVHKSEFRLSRGGLGRINQGNIVNQGVGYVGTWLGSATTITKEQVSHSSSRFAYSTSDLLGYLHRRVPRELPYWDARTYLYIPLTILPRVLVPWKPKTTSGVDFGVHYDLAAPRATTSSTNLPFSAEAYVNFGIAGILLVGLALGIVLGALGRVAGGGSWPMAVMGIVATAQLIGGIESDTSVVIGAAIWVGAAAYVLARWAEPALARRPAPA